MLSRSKINKARSGIGVNLFSPIRLLLKNGHYVPAVILLCCCVDYLAKYYTGKIGGSLNKKNYIDFVKRFLPQYNSLDFYKIIRCGLIHSYNLGDKYLILKIGSYNIKNNLHLTKVFKNNQEIILIHPRILLEEVRTACKLYFKELKINENLQFNFLKNVDVIDTRRQTYKVKKR